MSADTSMVSMDSPVSIERMCQVFFCIEFTFWMCSFDQFINKSCFALSFEISKFEIKLFVSVKTLHLFEDVHDVNIVEFLYNLIDFFGVGLFNVFSEVFDIEESESKKVVAVHDFQGERQTTGFIPW